MNKNPKIMNENTLAIEALIHIGAIFNSIIDKSHPVNYGIESNSLPLFRNSNVYMTKSEQSFNNPIVYSPNPLMSGYISEENLSLLKKAAPYWR